MSGLDSAYVKEHLDGVLTELIAELVQIKPDDPIEWLANALRQHSRKQQAKVCQICIFEKKINYFLGWYCTSSLSQLSEIFDFIFTDYSIFTYLKIYFD